MAQIKLDKIDLIYEINKEKRIKDIILRRTNLPHIENKKIHALKNINLTIEDGDIFGIIGLSGAGKSTLVRCMNLLEKPTAGNVFLDEDKLNDLSPKALREKRRKIGMIFQQFNLLNQRTALKNVCYPLEIAGVTKKEAIAKAEELLSLVGMSDKKNSYPSQLSGGQKQRVAIARALATDPKVLLCDEATSALDPDTTNSILELLKNINEEMGVTIVIITHEMSIVEKICSKMAILDSGEIVESGAVSEIFLSPKSQIGRKLIIPKDEFSIKRMKQELSVTEIYEGEVSYGV